MLRQVFIVKDDVTIYTREFGKALDEEGFKQTYKEISKEAYRVAVTSIAYHDYFRYRLSYLSDPEHHIVFIFASDLSDKFENVKKELETCKREFLAMFETILDQKMDAETFAIFDPTVDAIHKNLRPKISLVGFSGVGKTTITRLITAEEIPVEHIPTITGDIGTIKIGKLHFHLWDFAGQEQFSFLWGNFVKGSDAVFLITDSTLENCEKSKYFTELIKKEAPYAHTAAIGNKQDLPEAMPIAEIERHLAMKAYSMVATDVNNRDKMITIIADVLEMSAEVSPLLRPLLDRDRKVQDAEKALERGDFSSAVTLFDEVAQLCLELGDDRVSQDFHEKSQKIKGILRQSEAVNPAPVAAPTPAPTEIPPAPILPPSQNAVDARPSTGTPETVPNINVPPRPTIQAPPPKPNIQAPPPKPNIVAPPKPNIQAPKPNIPPPPAAAGTESVTPVSVAPAPAPAQSSGKVDQLGLLLAKLQKKSTTSKAATPPPPGPLPTSFGAVPSKLMPTNNIPPPAPKTTVPPPPMPKATVPPPPMPTTPTARPPMPTSHPKSSAASITDLKIKLANLNKNLLDLEMQNIGGEISDDEYKVKVQEISESKAKIEKQIKEMSS